MLRLVDLTVIDGENSIYRLPSARVEHIFDGDVVLETSCYQIDAIDMRIKLKRTPASAVRALVWMAEGGHHKNYVYGDRLEYVVKPTDFGERLKALTPDPSDRLYRLMAEGFESVVRELKEIRRESSQMFDDLRRANAR